MYEHHRRAIDALVAAVAHQGTFQAVIVVGSVVTGRARPASDIDVYLVASEDEYAARRARGELAWFAPCDYEDGYVDGKIISMAFLEAAAERGSEPTRSSFHGALVAHSTVARLQELVDQIPVYPEATRTRNIQDFYSYFALHSFYFARQALEREEPFLLTHSLSKVVLYAGRLILAHNRVLFPCPKQLLDAVASCPEKPEGAVPRSLELLRSPTAERLDDYMALINGFTDWGVPYEQVLTRFMELDEWSWLAGEPALSQR